VRISVGGKGLDRTRLGYPVYRYIIRKGNGQDRTSYDALFTEYFSQNRKNVEKDKASVL